MKKEEVIKLLKKRNLTYKELASITGYHEKSLIRLNKDIKNNNVRLVHGNKNKKPHNYIPEKIKKEIVKTYQKGDFKSIKEYYLFLNKKYSYSFLCKIIPKKEIVKDILLPRKAIKDNIIQYNNIRYRIIDGNIKHHNTVYLNPKRNYIIYKNKEYNIIPIKELKSKKGLSKYN